jgi:tRNA1(Val) A37 N6-methylase TrmN6
MDELTEDRLLGGRVVLRQKPGGFRVAIDAVLLAAACPAGTADTILDAGCGVGSAGLCAALRTGCAVAGLDVQADCVALAEANAAANGVAGRYDALAGSIAAPPSAIAGRSFDHALCNPPYLPERYGSAEGKRETHESDGVTLADWVDFCSRRVRDGGSVVFVHRADRLPELLALMSVRLGALAIFPLWPRAGESAQRVLVGGIKGRRTPPCLLPGLALHRAEGGFTPEAEAILRDAQPIRLWTP